MSSRKITALLRRLPEKPVAAATHPFLIADLVELLQPRGRWDVKNDFIPDKVSQAALRSLVKAHSDVLGSVPKQLIKRRVDRIGAIKRANQREKRQTERWQFQTTTGHGYAQLASAVRWHASHSGAPLWTAAEMTRLENVVAQELNSKWKVRDVGALVDSLIGGTYLIAGAGRGMSRHGGLGSDAEGQSSREGLIESELPIAAFQFATQSIIHRFSGNPPGGPASRSSPKLHTQLARLLQIASKCAKHVEAKSSDGAMRAETIPSLAAKSVPKLDWGTDKQHVEAALVVVQALAMAGDKVPQEVFRAVEPSLRSGLETKFAGTPFEGAAGTALVVSVIVSSQLVTATQDLVDSVIHDGMSFDDCCEITAALPRPEEAASTPSSGASTAIESHATDVMRFRLLEIGIQRMKEQTEGSTPQLPLKVHGWLVQTHFPSAAPPGMADRLRDARGALGDLTTTWIESEAGGHLTSPQLEALVSTVLRMGLRSTCGRALSRRIMDAGGPRVTSLLTNLGPGLVDSLALRKFIVTHHRTLRIERMAYLVTLAGQCFRGVGDDGDGGEFHRKEFTAALKRIVSRHVGLKKDQASLSDLTYLYVHSSTLIDIPDDQLGDSESVGSARRTRRVALLWPVVQVLSRIGDWSAIGTGAQRSLANRLLHDDLWHEVVKDPDVDAEVVKGRLHPRGAPTREMTKLRKLVLARGSSTPAKPSPTEASMPLTPEEEDIASTEALV